MILRAKVTIIIEKSNKMSQKNIYSNVWLHDNRMLVKAQPDAGNVKKQELWGISWR